MQDSDWASLSFDLRVCRLNAIKKAAHKFAHIAEINVAVRGENEALVTIRPTKSGESMEQLRCDLRAETLDQELRETVAEETGPIRNLLLAQAFSPICFIEP